MSSKRGASTNDAYWDLVTSDIAHATDILRPYYEEWDGHDGFVSVEVSPDLARDTKGTVAQAKELWARLDRPNVMIKIPATAEGVPAITAALDGRLERERHADLRSGRYDEVRRSLRRRAWSNAWLRAATSPGSHRSRRSSSAGSTPRPTAGSRGHPLRGRAAVANAKLAYQHFLATFAGSRWDALAAKGARVQRPLWASTSTKNPDVLPHPLRRHADRPRHGEHARPGVGRRARGGPGPLQRRHGARRGRRGQGDDGGAGRGGVDFDDVTETFEREGVAAFSASFEDATDSLEKKARELTR